MKRLQILLIQVVLAGFMSASHATPPPQLVTELAPAGTGGSIGDLQPGRAGRGLANVPVVYFAYRLQDSTVELWATDGTASGTRRASSRPFASIYTVKIIADPDGGALYVGQNANGGAALYRTDGDEATARLVVDGISDVHGLLDGYLLASIRGADTHLTYYKIDPYTGAAAVVALGIDATELVVSDENYFVVGHNPVDFSSYLFGSFTWQVGTPDWLPAQPPSSVWDYPHRLTAAKSFACFKSTVTYPGLNPRNEPSCSDGSADGTHHLIATGSSHGPLLPDFVTFHRVATHLVFATYFEQPIGLWSTDGTSAATQLIVPGGGIVCSDDDLGGVYVSTATSALWFTDGTLAGSHFVAQLGATCSAQGTNLGVMTYLPASGQLYQTDGTSDGTKPVSGAPPMSNSTARHFARVGQHLIFVAYPETQIWRIDAENIFADGFSF